MYLKEMEIINWQCIHQTFISYENMMLFIRQSNSGKSSILSAVMCFLNFMEINDKDIRNGTEHMIIEGKFYNSREKKFHIKGVELRPNFFKLKIYKKINEDAKFYYFLDNKWIEITKDEYKNIVKLIAVLYIPTLSNIVETKKFIQGLLAHLQQKKENIIQELNKVFEELKEEYISHGLYRNIIFEALCLIAYESRKLEKSILEDCIIIFEEPEIYLHPQKEKELFYCLSLICKFGGQVYVTTHSSNFISLNQYKSICIVRKNDELGSKVFQYKGTLFHGDEIKNFNMNYWINPDRSELFFARKVILVEGQTDKIILSYLGKKLGVYKYDYSILECGSKSLIPQFLRLLNIFKIPYIAVYDKDNHYWRSEKEIENSNAKNNQIKSLIDRKFGDFVEFENDIEEEIYQEKRERKNYKNKPFYALKHVISEDYIIPKNLKNKVLKIFL